MDKQSLIKRLNADPARTLLFSKVLDRFFLCVHQQEERAFTDFFDPITLASFIQAIGNWHEVTIRAYGGTLACERQILGFALSEDGLPDDSFPICKLRASFNTKFHHAPRHQDILGAVLGLGIDRGRVGDIRIHENGGADLFIHAEIAGYVHDQLDKAGRTPITVEYAQQSSAEEDLPQATEKTLTVASLRLDAIIAAVFHLSRTEASALIAGEKVFINWNPIKEPAKLLKEQDMISVRGQGRVQLVGVDGKTKKDRLRIRIAVPK